MDRIEVTATVKLEDVLAEVDADQLLDSISDDDAVLEWVDENVSDTRLAEWVCDDQARVLAVIEAIAEDEIARPAMVKALQADEPPAIKISAEDQSLICGALAFVAAQASQQANLAGNDGVANDAFRATQRRHELARNRFMADVMGLIPVEG